MGEVIPLQLIIQCGECDGVEFMIVDDGDIICPTCEAMASGMKAVFDEDIIIDLGDE